MACPPPVNGEEELMPAVWPYDSRTTFDTNEGPPLETSNRAERRAKAKRARQARKRNR